MSAAQSGPVAPAAHANAELRGHAAAEATLLRALRSARLPHAWLLSGPRGIGKATLAYRFARFVLAGGASPAVGLFQGGADADSLYLDPGHPAFRRVAALGHADLRALVRGTDEKTGRPLSEISVREVRAAGAFLRMTAGEGGWRIVIVDPVDELSRSAANALLKSLEEPPARALLLLVCHAPGRLPATLRSRCCHLALSPLEENEVAALLAAYAPELAAADVAALARLAEGSIGRALDLAAGGGLELYRELIGLIGGVPHVDVARLHAFGNQLAKDGDGTSYRAGVELLTWWLARLIRAGACGRLPPEVVTGEGAAMERLLGRRPLARWLTVWEKVGRQLSLAEAANLDRKQAIIGALLEFEDRAA